MAQVGMVLQESYKKDGKDIPLIVMDIRTITFRKKFTIAVNKLKFPEGKIDGAIAAGKEDHPDYHIWYNVSNRGESLPSVIVGSVKNHVSEGGFAYKKAKIFDPFISQHALYFAIFPVDKEKKVCENHLYNIVAEPYHAQNNNYANTQASALLAYAQENDGYAPTYDNVDTSTKDIPVIHEKIPF